MVISAWILSTSGGQRRRNYGKRDIRKDGKALLWEDLEWLLPLDAGSFAEPWSQGTWEDELEGRLSHYIALLDDGEPVAFGGFWLVAGEARSCGWQWILSAEEKNWGWPS